MVTEARGTLNGSRVAVEYSNLRRESISNLELRASENCHTAVVLGTSGPPPPSSLDAIEIVRQGGILAGATHLRSLRYLFSNFLGVARHPFRFSEEMIVALASAASSSPRAEHSGEVYDRVTKRRRSTMLSFERFT